MTDNNDELFTDKSADFCVNDFLVSSHQDCVRVGVRGCSVSDRSS